jgi:hypothetical protein
MKRAKHRALRDAFSLPALGIEEVGGGMPAAAIDGEVEDDDLIAGELVAGDLTWPPTERSAPPPTSQAQSRAIHATVRELGWSDAQYREALTLCFAVTSSKDLTENQASAFLEALRAEQEAAQFEQRQVRLPRGWLIDAMRRLAGEDRADDGGTAHDAELASAVMGVQPAEPGALPVEAAALPPSLNADADVPGGIQLAQLRAIQAEAKRLGYSNLQLAGFVEHRYRGRKLDDLSYAQAEDLKTFLEKTPQAEPKAIGGKEVRR